MSCAVVKSVGTSDEAIKDPLVRMRPLGSSHIIITVVILLYLTLEAWQRNKLRCLGLDFDVLMCQCFNGVLLF